MSFSCHLITLLVAFIGKSTSVNFTQPDTLNLASFSSPSTQRASQTQQHTGLTRAIESIIVQKTFQYKCFILRCVRAPSAIRFG
jgi:hypothetical protein